MRRFACILFLLCLTTPLFAGQEEVEADIISFRSLGTREDGSAEEKLAFAAIAKRLDQLAISYERKSLGSADRGHSFSEILIATLPGTLPGRMILLAPVDSGAFACAALLEYARESAIKPPKHETYLVFLGAERGSGPFYPFGGRQAILELEEGGPSFALYLDSEEVPEHWLIRTGGDGVMAPKWLVESITEVFSALFIPFDLRGADIQAARLGMQGDTGALSPWLDSEIPTVLMKGSGVSTGNERNRQISSFNKAISDMDARVTKIPEKPSSSFIFIRPLAGMTPRIIPELPFIIGFLGVSALLIAAVLIRSRAVNLNFKRYGVHWWAFPLLISLVFLFNFLSTIFVEEILLIADFPDLWKTDPDIFFFFKMTIAVSLSLIFILLTRGLPLPRSPHFYSYAAVITAGINTIVFLSVDLAFAAYSLWTTMMLLALISTKNEGRKIFFLVLSVIPFLLAAYVIISEPYEIIIQAIILDRVQANVILTMVMMPLIFTLVSINYWRSHYHQTRKRVMTPAATTILSTSTLITLLWILGLKPYGPGNPQPVDIADFIDLRSSQRKLTVSSPAPIGNAVLSMNEIRYELENLGRTAEVKTPLDRTPLAINHDSRRFLGRRIINLTVSGESNPKNIFVKLTSSSPFTIHECDFPYEMNPEGTSAEIFIGKNPPFPLPLRLTVNDKADLSLTLLSVWINPENPPAIDRTDMETTGSRQTILEEHL